MNRRAVSVGALAAMLAARPALANMVGDRVTGKVFHCDAKGAWVDIGAKAAALCPGSEASLAQARNVSTSSTPV